MAKAGLSLKRKTEGKGFEAVVDRSKPGGMKVGFVKGLGTHPNSNGATVAEIAAYNEFGTDTIPERPFLRTSIRENMKPVYAPMIKALLEKILNGQVTVTQAIGLLGEKASADVKLKIIAISDPPNADETIDKKGSTNPLIDTGLMNQSVTWEKVK